MKLKKLLLTSAVLTIAVATLAQDAMKTAAPATEKKKFNTWSVTANLGLLLFYGDIRQYDWYPLGTYQNERQLGYGFTLNKALTPVFGLQGQILAGKLSGTRRDQGVFFEANVFEYSLNATVNFSNLSFSGRLKQRKLSFYGLLGIGLTNFTSDKKDLGTEGVVKSVESTTETILPIGLGLKWKLNDKFDLGLELTARNVNTDKLDVTVSEGSALDKYGYTSLSLTYKIGKSDRPNVEWMNPLDVMNQTIEDIRAKVDGLGSDKDKDGVADLLDKDGATPEGTKVYGDGTSVDADADGVADGMDVEPFTPKGAQVDATGKETDSDNDGVADSKDQEPNTAAGALVNFQGKTIKVSAMGGGTVSGYESYMPVVFFEFNKTNITNRYNEALAALARIMVANPDVRVSLFGHGDAVGTEAANKEIGQKRAEAVKKYMVEVYGIDESRMEAVSKGKEEPFSNVKNTKDKDPLNRRVDYKIIK